jgi:hypothetical protein
MANLKFSGFTAAAAIDQTDSFLVGFDDDGGGANPTNNKWTFPEVADGLIAVTAKPYSIYAADGTIGTTRKALITDTVQFRNAGDTSDIFKLNTDGTFTLGDGAIHSNGTPNSSIVIGNSAVVTSDDTVVIGKSATTSVGGQQNVIIGADTSLANNTSFAVAIGKGATSNTNGIAIGYSSAVGGNGLAIGRDAEATGNPSITLNVSGSTAANSTANSFSVYMTSNTTPDFEVLGGGESTLNTSFKITGQAYTELHTGVTPLDPNWNNGNVQESTLTSGSSDFDPSNPKAGATYILKLTQPASGAAGTINWDNIGAANIKWPGGTEPTLTVTNGAVDIITLICTDSTGQGVYYGNATLDMQ